MKSRLFKQGGAAALLVLGGLFVGTMAYGVTEETPVGTFSGSALMKENGRPLPNADVVFSPIFELPDQVQIPKYTRTDDAGKFSVTGLPAGLYIVSVHGKVHSAWDQSVVVVEGKATDVKISTELSDPGLSLNVSRRVFLPEDEITLTLSGVLTEDQDVQVQTFRVSDEVMGKGADLYDISRSLVNQRNSKNPVTNPALKLVGKQDKAVTSRDLEGSFTESVTLDPMSEGIYMVRVTDGKLDRFGWFTVSRIAMVTKSAGGEGLSYVVDLKSGQPIQGVPVSFHTPTFTESLGKTDGNGIVKYKIPASGSDISVSAVHKKSRAITWFYSYGDSGDNTEIWMQTDRPVYQPGDEVQFRGVIRTLAKSGLKAPTSGNVQITVYDPDELVISKQTLTVNRFGSYHGKFASDKIAPPGGYRIQADFNGESGSKSVQVLQYRKPEFTISVKPERKAYRRGEAIKWVVKAEYFTGEPVVGSKITSTLYRGADWWGNPFEDEMPEDYESFGYYDEYLGEYTATTNAAGEAVITTPSGTFESEYADFTDYEYSLSVSVEDQSGRGFSGEGRAKVTRGSFDLTAEFDSWLADPNQAQTVTIQGTDYETGKGRAGQEVNLEFGRDRWTGNESVFVVVDRKTVKLDADGKASVPFTPDREGSYTVKAYAREGKTRVASEAWLWVGNGAADSGPAPSLQLVLNKKKYAGNEPAKALIRTNKPGGKALLTIESEGVKRARVVELKAEGTTVTLDDLASYAPGAEVAVAYIRDKTFSTATARLRVDFSSQKLNVSVTPDRTEAKPGEDVMYTIQAKDDSGKPVQAEVAVGVVDEGIYQILEDTSNPLTEFYAFGWNNVNTSYSFPDIYLDGEDKASPNVQVRKVFKDTAFWNPSVVTGADGSAKITVKMPDNLTSWRTTATAITADSKFGKEKCSVVVKKDLMARLSPPEFLVQGDTQAVSGLITNTTDREQVVEAKLIGVGIQVQGEASRKITVPARGAESVTWTLLAGSPMDAKLEFTAVAGSGLNDGLQQSFPIKPLGRRQVSGYASADTNGSSFDLEMDPDAVTGELTVSVEPSLASTMLTSIEELIQYPYGCTEQTMSKFMPAVAAQGLLEQVGAMPESLRDKLPTVTREGLRRIRRFQHYEGGWGWWEGNEPDERMTAVVMEGLFEARKAGLEVDPTMVDRGLRWSKDALRKVPDTIYDPKTKDEWSMRWKIEEISQIAYSTALYGSNTEVVKVNRALMRDDVWKHMGAAELARLALAWRSIAGYTSGALREEALANGRTAYEAMLALPKEDDLYSDAWWGEDNPRALQAIVAYEEDQNKASNFAIRMLPRRKSGGWTSTRTASIYVLAINDHLRKIGITAISGDLEILVNGRSVARQAASITNQKVLKAVVPMDALQKGANKIQVVAAGGMAPVVVARMDQVVGMSEIPPMNEGSLTVSREYVRMEAQRIEDGSLRLVPSKTPWTNFRTGEVLRCRIKIVSDQNEQYVMVEDPIPSGFRIVEADQPFSSYGSWDWWWDSTAFYDDRAVFFKTELPKGESVMEYSVRAEAEGRSVALPTSVSPMYQPQTFGSSGSIAIEVRR